MVQLPVILRCDPKPLKGSESKMFKPWWMICYTECDISRYYSWLLHRRTGLILQEPAWGPHISVVRGEEPPRKDLWTKYDGRQITIEYETDVRTNGEHWWLRIVSEDLKDIREELGLPRQGAFGLHLTLGRPIPRCVESSYYFHREFSRV